VSGLESSCSVEVVHGKVVVEPLRVIIDLLELKSGPAFPLLDLKNLVNLIDTGLVLLVDVVARADISSKDYIGESIAVVETITVHLEEHLSVVDSILKLLDKLWLLHFRDGIN